MALWLDQHQFTLSINPEIIEQQGGTFIRHGLSRPSIIDLAFERGFSQPAIQDWHYPTDQPVADHKLIGFYLSTGPLIPIQTPRCLFNYKRTDWRKFHTSFQSTTASLSSLLHTATALSTPEDLDSLAEGFTRGITTAL